MFRGVGTVCRLHNVASVHILRSSHLQLEQQAFASQQQGTVETDIISNQTQRK